MLLEKFITALHLLELKPTAEELADIFWLTAQIRRTMPTESTIFSQENPIQPKLPEEPLSLENPQDTQDTNDNNQESNTGIPVYAQDNKVNDQLSLRVPATRYLPHSLKLARALRPLKQRVPSRKYCQLNETATVEQIAQTRLWLPVIQGIPERHFDVVLVIEKSASMVIWQPVITEFRKLLEYQGAFRNVQEWTMEYEHDDLVLSHRCKEMFDPTRRRLILVITDCISLAWYSQKFIDLLTEWSRHHPIAIVQLLPQRMWRGTSLSQTLRVNFKASAAHVTNAQLQSDANEFWLAEDIPNGMKMPVITLERYSLGNWAKLVAGRGNDWVTGVIFEKEAMPRETPLPAAIDATDRINRFFAMASPTAQRLACYLTVAPLTIEIMRMVQHKMLPESEQVHLAEVFLGGLLKPDKSEFTEYDFHDGIRTLLSKALSDAEIDEIFEKTTKFINERFGQCLDFRAGLSPIPSEALSFAQIEAKILKSLGGKYLNFAKQIERSIETSQLKAGELFQDVLKDGSLGPKMVVIPKGSFKMGSNDGYDDEKPVHTVTIDYEFAMGQYEVTFEEYDKFCEATGRKKPDDRGWGRGKRPVIYVDWNDAKAYCQWLSNQTGKEYRLPSEAEWEYACRAGSTGKYCFGDDEKQLQDYAWYSKNSSNKTHPVGEKKPNKFGLYDMHGNVWEWCEDNWHNDYNGAPTDGSAWMSGSSDAHLLRGGSWFNDDRYLRCAYRNRDDATYWDNYGRGFRLSRM